MKRSLLLLVFISCCIQSLKAKGVSSDFATWSNWSLVYNIDKNLKIGCGIEYKTENMASKTDRWGFSTEVEYSLLSFFDVGCSYEFHLLNETNRWDYRHRYNLSLTGSWKLGNFSFSIRERFQHSIYNNHEFRLRSRAQTKFVKLPKVKPYLSTEIYNSIHQNDKFQISRVRYQAGTEVKISKNIYVDLYYLHQRESEKIKHVAGIDLSFTLL